MNSNYYLQQVYFVSDLLSTIPFTSFSQWSIPQLMALFGDLSKGSKIIGYSTQGSKLKRSYSDIDTVMANSLKNETSEFLNMTVEKLKQAKISETGVVHYTMLYGDGFLGIFENIITWLRMIGVTSVLIIAIGEEGIRECNRISDNLRPNGVVCWTPSSRSQVHRYTLASIAVNNGFDVFYFDLDVLFLKNPTLHLLSNYHHVDKDMFIARHTDGNCVNVGLLYFKSTNSTQQFLRSFINWYHLHPYEIDQRGMQAFLDGSNENIGVSFLPKDLPKLNWAIFEDVNEFVTSNPGWFGLFDRVVAVHFLEMNILEKVKALRPIYETLLVDHEDRDFLENFRLQEESPRRKCW